MMPYLNNFIVSSATWSTNSQHAKAKDIQQSTIIFEAYKNHLLTLIGSHPFQKLNQQFSHKKTR